MTAPDEVVDSLVAAEDSLLQRGRAAVGVSGNDEVEPLRTVLRRNGVTLFPVVVLGLLAFVDGFQGLVLGTLGPEVSRSLGIGVTALTSLLIVKALALSLASVIFADLVGKRPIRALIASVTAIGWSLCTFFTGLVRTPGQLAIINAVDGVTSASVGTVQQPMLLDCYPPAIRIRINGIRTAIILGSSLLAPVSVSVLVGVFHLTWRGCLLVLAVVSLVVSCSSFFLRDPGFGRYDSDQVKAEVEQAEDPGGQPVVLSEDAPLGFFEAARRVFLIPTMRKAITLSVVGSMAAPVNTYFNFFLDEHWHLGPTGRANFGIVTSAISIVLLLVTTPLGDKLFQRDPSDMMKVLTATGGFGGLLVLLAVLSPWLVPMMVLYGIGTALPQALAPVTSTTFLNIIPPRMRGTLIALLAVMSVAAGETAGNLLLGGLNHRLGLQGAILTISLVISPVTLWMFWTMHRTINADLDATVRATIEAEELAALRRSGVRPPLLACRGINFSYGQLQVLFDVDFTVDDGEMVALLGTNGAGKSTLLSVVSGLNLPSRGSVRLDGADITYVDAERRTRMGMSQINGGKATFGPLTVAENLRLFGFSHGRDTRSVERGIEESFAAFPRLAERRNQLASTLSGGEQQMLGLSQALILKPRLLCIDELSLGLAPKIVGELLAMVRSINDTGTAVILVEQSATIALSLVDHAYFMERGSIRFDGAAADLLGRDDLLRSVFLEGAQSAVRVGGHR